MESATQIWLLIWVWVVLIIPSSGISPFNPAMRQTAIAHTIYNSYSYVAEASRCGAPRCGRPSKRPSKRAKQGSISRGFDPGSRGFGRPSPAASKLPIPASPPEGPEWRAFESWLVERGAHLNGVELADCGEGLRGLRTTKACNRGDELIRIPRSLILDTKRADARLGALWADGPPLPRYAKLALLVLLEQQLGPTSDVAPYIEILPTPADFEAEGGPTTLWTKEELEVAECPKLSTDAVMRYERWASSPVLEHDAFAAGWRALGLDGAAPSKAQLRWAVAAVTSRAYGAVDSDGSQASLLIPMVDMANHQHPPNTAKGLEEDGQHFVVIATQPLPKGAQVFLSYGALPNIVLLSQFGFMLSAISQDYAIVDCAHLKEAEPTAALEAVEQGLLMRDADGTISTWQPAGPQLRAALTLLAERDALPAQLLQQACHTGGGTAASIPTGTIAYATMIKRTLSRFSTTIAQDRAALKDVSLAPRARLALRFRIEQQVILNRELASQGMQAKAHATSKLQT
mmetsp:Transcript_67007/g.111338  ORF Transcript_67007/g.111338 Transcript_67007/m.111338 type:complete len:516 (+) Transcript_67007:44-1591(+)|eukprot:CAMPEP_0119313688 /NCGR_PEP_ID=MMETSP1333-20130426/30006_1 /TAXON_ID=418940 /ORGANISM="Scyphosphaera apsteinii, Strain RCC1455" /LENGTH=515 /DNA_ID=CAMNT_0007318585 /DNA_START=41 /DNA_END=1588 /DNA_ORIENTATION=-